MARRASKKNIAKPHTIKKFEVIERYVDEWARIILGYRNSTGIMFIDCMSNSGIYEAEDGSQIYGTPIRIANLLNTIADNYPTKSVDVFFNDIDADKIDILKSNTKYEQPNINLHYSIGDANQFLKNFNRATYDTQNCNILLFYDPYQAAIDWSALEPFLNGWGEVILNHMVSDTIRGVQMVQDKEKIKKYQQTYQRAIDDLIRLGNDRKQYEEIIRQILREKSDRRYIASFPFYNRQNVMLYNIIYLSNHIKGHKLFKKVVWQTFDGKSSIKPIKQEAQIEFDLDNIGMLREEERHNDSYTVDDIVNYLCDHYAGKGEITLDEVYNLLDEHPIFPSDGYKNQIKDRLKLRRGVECKKQHLIFN